MAYEQGDTPEFYSVFDPARMQRPTGQFQTLMEAMQAARQWQHTNNSYAVYVMAPIAQVSPATANQWKRGRMTPDNNPLGITEGSLDAAHEADEAAGQADANTVGPREQELDTEAAT